MDSGWRLFIRTIVARAYPRVIGQMRQRSWLFFETALPFVAVTAYVYVYRAMEASPDFIGFAVMGGAMTAFWLNIIWSMTAQMYWEKDNGNLALYIMAPNSKMAILLGMALGGMVSTSLRAAVILVFGIWIFHIHFAVSSFALLAAVFLLTMTALYGLGMLSASLFLLFGRNFWQIIAMMQEPVYLVSGFYFPVKNFGLAVSLAASILPMTFGMDAMRQLMFTSGPAIGFLPLRTEIIGLVILSVGFVTAAKYWLDKVERLAIMEGTLTDRRK